MKKLKLLICSLFLCLSFIRPLVVKADMNWSGFLRINVNEDWNYRGGDYQFKNRGTSPIYGVFVKQEGYDDLWNSIWIQEDFANFSMYRRTTKFSAGVGYSGYTFPFYFVYFNNGVPNACVQGKDIPSGVQKFDNAMSALNWIREQKEGPSVTPTPTPSITPEPTDTPIGEGMLNIKYKSNIVGTGNGSLNSSDVILWDLYDTFGRDISGATVEIKVFPAQYNADSKDSLFEKGINSLIKNTTFSTLFTVNASVGQKEFKWSDIVNFLNLRWINVWSGSLFNNNWVKEGWYYEARYIYDGYFSPWQVVYPVTASPPAVSNNIINSISYSQEIYNSYEEIISINENIEVIVNYKDDITVIVVPSTPSGDDEHFYEKYFKRIIELLNAILDKLKNLTTVVETGSSEPDDDLVAPDPNDYWNHFGVFNEIKDVYTTIEEQFDRDLDPVISWSDIVYMEVVLIPAGSIDLRNLVAEAPLSTFYDTYKILISGFISIKLIELYYFKFMEIFRK